MKNIVLTCKLFNADAQYFIDPLIECKHVDRLFLYRNNSPEIKNDTWSRKGEGIYHHNRFKFLNRFFRMLYQRKVDLFIGIYEIPHGLIALIVAIIRKKLVVVSIIGNPKYSLRNEGFRGVVTNWIYKKANAVTVTGTQSKNYLIDQKKLNPNKVFILPNSLPIDEFNIKGKTSKKKYDLVTIGRLSPEKGLIQLIEIINELRKDKPDIKLGIAGKGPQMDELKENIKELQLEDHIDLLGFVESAGEFLKSGKVFITTSLTEGLPRTAIQSMLMGLPVIASNVGDMSDLVINNKTGYLVEDPTSSESFSRAILIVLGKQDNYDLLCRNASMHAQNNYGHQTATKVWDEIIHYIENINN